MDQPLGRVSIFESSLLCLFLSAESRRSERVGLIEKFIVILTYMSFFFIISAYFCISIFVSSTASLFIVFLHIARAFCVFSWYLSYTIGDQHLWAFFCGSLLRLVVFSY